MSSVVTLIRIAETEAEARLCFPLMKQLRPHLLSEDEFALRWARQVRDGYRLMMLLSGEAGREKVAALAGFRVQENLVYGRFLYVDDLVSDESARGAGFGAQLIERLKIETKTRGCGKLVLDTALSNSLAQRFYFRCGMLATAMRFNFAVA
jgi:ribosomal protein S18 acetylase RimI-like enzyme